jgi:hypothetical protein
MNQVLNAPGMHMTAFLSRLAHDIIVGPMLGKVNPSGEEIDLRGKVASGLSHLVTEGEAAMS